MGERVRDPERTRRAVLDAAEALFAAKGFAATSLQEIADRAGVSRGTPSYFFATKERLYQAVLDRVPARPAAKGRPSRLRHLHRRENPLRRPRRRSSPFAPALWICNTLLYSGRLA